MKTLYLVRHAKSSWKGAYMDDIDRPLNKRGKRDAPFMGKLLHDKGHIPDIFMSSPANRAQTTATFFAEQLNYPEDKIIVNNNIYEAGINDLLNSVEHDIEDRYHSAMLFGHNMTYTMFANLYAQPALDNMPTCSIVQINYDVNSWAEITSENGKLVFFEYPRKYFPKGNS